MFYHTVLFLIFRLNFTHYFIIGIPSKRDLQQVGFDHSSDDDFKDFMNLYKKCTAKLCSFSVNDITLVSNNPLHFEKNLSERKKKLLMKIDDKIRYEKLQFDINREATKISALSSV